MCATQYARHAHHICPIEDIPAGPMAPSNQVLSFFCIPALKDFTPLTWASSLPVREHMWRGFIGSCLLSILNLMFRMLCLKDELNISRSSG